MQWFWLQFKEKKYQFGRRTELFVFRTPFSEEFIGISAEEKYWPNNIEGTKKDLQLKQSATRWRRFVCVIWSAVPLASVSSVSIFVRSSIVPFLLLLAFGTRFNRILRMLHFACGSVCSKCFSNSRV